MASWMTRILGAEVPASEYRAHRLRYLAPGTLLVAARFLLLASIFLPYWHMELEAPQYPNGLFLTAYVNVLQGDVKEIDGLNHYIGMRPLGEAASMERETAVWLIMGMFLLVEIAARVRSKWAVVLVAPAALFPGVFLLDLKYWMTKFGQNLDPGAPLSSSVKPFTPTVLGEGGIGQFKTYAELGNGYWMAVAAAGLIVVALALHRMAYKPLLDRAMSATTDATVEA